jgi:hypothetical protein
LDLAKRVFQLHWVDLHSGEVKRKTLTRTQVSAHGRLERTRSTDQPSPTR